VRFGFSAAAASAGAASALGLRAREARAEAVAPAVAGPLLVLADDELRAEHVLGHPGGDLRAGELVAEARLTVPADQQHLGLEGLAFLHRQPIDEQPLALADAVLLPADLDDRVAHP
jgi:hypothetical protein